MALGAAHRFVDLESNLLAANVNSLDAGLNVYHSPNGGLYVRVTGGSVWLAKNGATARTAIAAVGSDQAVAPSTTNYVYLDESGTLVINATGFPTLTPALPLATVTTDGSEVTAIADSRPRVVLPHSFPSYPGGIPVVGSYLAQLPTKPNGTTSGLSADTLYGWPLYLVESATFDRLALRVSTLEVSGSIRLGIYEDSDGLPGALVEDAGTVSTTTTGLKEITLAASVELKAGRYWLATVFGGTTMQATAYAQTQHGACPLPAATLQSPSSGYRGGAGSQAVASALPDPFGATPTLVALNPPVFGLRAA